MINCFLPEPSAGSASSSTSCLLLEGDAGVERLQTVERNSAISTWHGLALMLFHEPRLQWFLLSANIKVLDGFSSFSKQVLGYYELFRD
jgi:hypothetical protein